MSSIWHHHNHIGHVAEKTISTVATIRQRQREHQPKAKTVQGVLRLSDPDAASAHRMHICEHGEDTENAGILRRDLYTYRANRMVVLAWHQQRSSIIIRSLLEDLPRLAFVKLHGHSRPSSFVLSINSR
ncbi:hypothetical protein L1887_54426 [Cichorium endivia]|nr:hypothetical protein L1887_54426 [Cichorium endivia]